MTGKVPPALLSKPILPPEGRDLWNAYNSLSGSRRIGLSAGPIPVSEVLSYCELVGIADLDERELLLTVVQTLDILYFNRKKEKKGKP